MSTLNIIQNTSDGSTKTARTVDPYEFQMLYPGEAEGTVTLSQWFTDNPDEAMQAAGQLKFDEEVIVWDWLVNYSDGTREFAFRSIWLEDGEIPEDTRCN